jgi:signal transduction histidine kinase
MGVARDITERKELEREVINAATNERRRIGYELHDGLGQYLSGVAFRAKALEEALVAEGGALASEASELAALVSNAILQTRSLARGLDPVEVETIGLVAALQNLVCETEKYFRVSCQVQFSGPDPKLEAEAGLTLYRLAQEAIHNALTHSSAERITVELQTGPEGLRLEIKDNGVGFDMLARKPGMGLRVMGYRARSIGARFEIRTQPGRGTEVRCFVPPPCSAAKARNYD